MGKGRKRANITSMELVRTRHEIIGILPYVKITHLNRDANLATKVSSDTLRLTSSPVKSRRKVVGRISCSTEGVQTIGLRGFQIQNHGRSLFYGNGRAEHWDQIAPPDSPRARGTT